MSTRDQCQACEHCLALHCDLVKKERTKKKKKKKKWEKKKTKATQSEQQKVS
jgi:ferredoxin